jgi:hypothetical protein
MSSRTAMMPMIRVPMVVLVVRLVFGDRTGSDQAAPIGVRDGAEEKADSGEDEDEVLHG